MMYVCVCECCASSGGKKRSFCSFKLIVIESCKPPSMRARNQLLVLEKNIKFFLKLFLNNLIEHKIQQFH